MRSMLANWPAAGPSAPAHGRALGIAALITWVLTVSLGAYMARAWIGGGGLRQRRASGDLPPAVLLAHAGLAVAGLLLWAGYVASGLAGLAWAATGILATAIGLGVSTVTLWTPYPVRQPARAGDGPPDAPDSAAFEVTDEMLRALLDNPAPARRRRRPQALIPLFHGIGAITTFLVAVLTAVGTL